MKTHIYEELIKSFVREAAHKDPTLDRFMLEDLIRKVPVFEKIAQKLNEEIHIEYDGEGHFFAYDDKEPKKIGYGVTEEEAEEKLLDKLSYTKKMVEDMEDDNFLVEFANLKEEDTGLTRKVKLISDTRKEGQIPFLYVYSEKIGSPAILVEIPSSNKHPVILKEEKGHSITPDEANRTKKWISKNRETLIEFWEKGNSLFVEEICDLVKTLIPLQEDSGMGQYSYADGYSLTPPEKEVRFDIKHLTDLEPFDSQIQYAHEHLDKIGEGSARVVFALDESKVIKIAKNSKGMAQNRMEANKELQKKYPIVAQTHDVEDDSYFWIVEDRAEHIDEEQFKELTGLDFNDFSSVLKYEWSKVKGKKKEKPSAYETVLKNQFFHTLLSMLMKYDMPYLDYAKLKHYGKIDNEVKLIDYGLTREVWRKYYKDDESGET